MGESPYYTTKEFKTPTKNTSKNHKPVPEKTIFLDEDQPSGEANKTGTPTTKAKDKAIKAKRAIWNKKSIIDLIKTIFLRLSELCFPTQELRSMVGFAP